MMTLLPAVFVDPTFNPIMDEIKSCFSDLAISPGTDACSSDIIISFAYHSPEDIVAMDTMKTMIAHPEYLGKCFIFLSWYHPVEHIGMYPMSELLSPEQQSCILMDCSKYQILQLPVEGSDIKRAIEFLLNANGQSRV